MANLILAADNSRIAGIQLRRSNSPLLTAQLVVDASGRHSKAPTWLATLGYEPPSESVAKIPAYTFTSCLCPIPAIFADSWKQLVIHAAGNCEGQSLSISQIEGRRWLVTITTEGNLRAPTKWADFITFIENLGVPAVSQLLDKVQWLTTISSYRVAYLHRRHYDTLSEQPDNFVVLGDAVCVFDPAFGQGMSIAAKEALLLGECVQERWPHKSSSAFTGFARHFQQSITPLIDEEWALETAG